MFTKLQEGDKTGGGDVKELFGYITLQSTYNCIRQSGKAYIKHIV